MHIVNRIELKEDTKEELLPDFSANFPYIASKSLLDVYPGRCVPWHWHNAVELFYMESGELEYSTPGGVLRFPAGSGGLVNSNVLHMTRLCTERRDNVQLLHLFDPVLIAGMPGSLIDRKYVMPLTTASQIELIPLFPENSEHQEILELLRESFALQEEDAGYEIRLRQMLSEIWLKLLEAAREQMKERSVSNKSNEQIKQMMIYVQEHYGEKISIEQLANAAYVSERACYRIFQSCLHMTPTDYLISYRLQMACQMLAKGNQSLTDISHSCGLGTSSYFGKVFKENFGCTPTEYRRKWQDSDNKEQN